MAETAYGPGADADPSRHWLELGPCEHVVQFYEADDGLIHSLTGFVSGALHMGDAAIIIATPRHRQMLEDSLDASGVNVAGAQAQDRIIFLEAEATLQLLLRDRWPDSELFATFIGHLLSRSRRQGRNVRVFGEMVALLWAREARSATVRLEHLWEEMCTAECFPLLCAYPTSAFGQNRSRSMREICEAHSRVLAH